MAGDQATCIVCNTPRSGGSSHFHQITYERTKWKPDDPSLAERVCKILKIDDIYSTSSSTTYPLMMCSSCLREMEQIENAAKVKKKFKKSFKKGLSEVSNGAPGCRNERKRSGQKSGDKKSRKERRMECELSAGDLELCVKEIDELITHIIQDELMSKGKTSSDKTQDSGLLSTELAIVKETFCEMEKEIRQYESTTTEASGSTKHASESVTRELLMKHRITLEYKDKLAQHLNRMISYISKHKSRFDCNADGLHKFCTILEVVYSQKSRPHEGGDVVDDSSSMSSSLSSFSCSGIATTLKQSVNDIFKQTAAQIAEAWREASESEQTNSDQITTKEKPQTAAKETPIPNTTEDDEMVIGAQMQKIINGHENDEEIIDIESVGSEESNEEEQVSDKTKTSDDDQKASAEEKKVDDDGSGEASSSSNQDGAMIIDDDTEEEEEKQLKREADFKVKKEPVVSSQDDIQEIEQEKKDAPVVICIDSDDEDEKEDGERKNDKIGGSDNSQESFHESTMLSYEETRWQHQQTRPKDCFVVPPVPSSFDSVTSQNRTNQNNSNSRTSQKPSRYSNVTGVVYGNMINPSSETQEGRTQQNISKGTGMQPSSSGNRGQKYPMVTGVQFGSMVSGCPRQDRPRHDQSGPYAFKRHTTVWSPAKDFFVHRQQNFAGFGRNKFNFNKKKMHWNQQSAQQGNVNMMNSNRRKQKFQFKAKKFQNSNAFKTGGSIPTNENPGTSSKLDIIPVISGPIKQTPQNLQNKQGNQQIPGQSIPSGSAAPTKHAKKRKFKLKKKQQHKKQHHYNQGSKPALAKQSGGQGNSHARTSGGMHQGGKPFVSHTGHQGYPHGRTSEGMVSPSPKSLVTPKTNQPPVMKVLGGSKQTLHVKAKW